MNMLNDDLQTIIYTYKHQIEFRAVLNELNKFVDLWCDQQLTYRFLKFRHRFILQKCQN